MAVVRPTLAMDPRRFGKAPIPPVEVPQSRAPVFGDDVRLFAITFAAGFLFVSILIG